MAKKVTLQRILLRMGMSGMFSALGAAFNALARNQHRLLYERHSDAGASMTVAEETLRRAKIFADYASDLLAAYEEDVPDDQQS